MVNQVSKPNLINKAVCKMYKLGFLTQDLSVIPEHHGLGHPVFGAVKTGVGYMIMWLQIGGFVLSHHEQQGMNWK